MADRTGISWADSTFNPWIGCTKVSPACDNCYAEREWQDRRHVVNWGPGAPRKRTTAANWKLPIRWNAKPFCECSHCDWRGEQAEARRIVSSGSTKYWCPSCGVHTVKPARRRVFCASLADVFDNEVPTEWRRDLFALIHSTPNLDWLILTKRIGNAHRMLPPDWVAAPPAREIPRMPDNVWIGASVCNQAEADRDIPKLLDVPAAVRFLSIEPMLGEIELNGNEYRVAPGLDEGIDWLTGKTSQASNIFGGDAAPWRSRDCYDFPQDAEEPRIHWVICGGESGPKARPMSPDWARSLRDQCAAVGVPFLFKQWGEWIPMLGQSEGVPVKQKTTMPDGWVMGWAGCNAAGCLLDGREHHEFPIKT